MGEMADFIIESAFDGRTCEKCFRDFDYCECSYGPTKKVHDPKCKGREIERLNRGTNESFIGCSEFPKCKYTRNL